jgi:hypothetical protein
MGNRTWNIQLEYHVELVWTQPLSYRTVPAAAAGFNEVARESETLWFIRTIHTAHLLSRVLLLRERQPQSIFWREGFTQKQVY